jgi:hypothetical protein
VIETLAPAKELASRVARAVRDAAPHVALVGARSVAALNQAGRLQAEVGTILGVITHESGGTFLTDDV